MGGPSWGHVGVNRRRWAMTPTSMSRPHPSLAAVRVSFVDRGPASMGPGPFPPAAEFCCMATALNAPTSEFEKKDRCADLDHRPRVLLGKMGLDGHDRGVKVIARALRDSGIHVIYSGLWQTPRSLAISARDEDCDCIAASMMSNSHLVLGPKLVHAARELGRPDMPIYMGGILPQEDIPKLIEGGVAKCFTTGVGLIDIVNAVREATRERGESVGAGVTAQLARDVSLVHAGKAVRKTAKLKRPPRVIGVTGSPGAGKSTLVAQLVGEYTRRAKANPSLGRCAVIA